MDQIDIQKDHYRQYIQYTQGDHNGRREHLLKSRQKKDVSYDNINRKDV